MLLSVKEEKKSTLKFVHDKKAFKGKWQQKILLSHLKETLKQ